MKFWQILLLLLMGLPAACSPAETVLPSNQTESLPATNTPPAQKPAKTVGSAPSPVPSPSLPTGTPPATREAVALSLPGAEDAATPGAPAQNTKPVLVYQRSGGIAGLSETWALYADGSLVDSQGQTLNLPPAQVQNLLDEIETLGFFNLKEQYLPVNPCCDRMTHVISVRWNGQSNRVTTMDDASETPLELQQILTKLWQLFKPGLTKPPLPAPDR